MKNNIFNIKLVIILAGLLVLTGCEKQLESLDYQNLTAENFFKTEEDFNAAVIALYNPFTSHWGDTDPGNNVWYAALYNCNNRTYLMRGELVTDEIAGVGTYDADLTNFTWGPATYPTTGTGGSTYSKIRYVARATDVIDKISKSDANDIIKNSYIAQAKILRAWLMYTLYDFFGPLNVKLDPETLGDTEIIPRLSEADYLAAIEQDLLDAIALDELPDKYNTDAANWGRVSKGVARMLLLKLYMHTKQWPDAEAVAMDIVDMGYSLMSRYEDVFTTKANNELIYAIPASDASPNWWPQHLFPAGHVTGYLIGNDGDTSTIERGSGWYMYAIPWDFYSKFPANDDRKSTIIASYLNSDGEVVDNTNENFLGAIPLKYTNIVGGGPDYPIDLVVFRYAEVLLSLAETINERRGPDDAYQYVNQVRARAGLWDWSGFTQEEFRDSILDERGRELFAEGARRQDLIRHGKLIEFAIDRGVTNAQAHHVLFPIPVDVIIEGNGIINQNDGYN